MRVLASALNVRSGPGTRYRVISQLLRDERVTVKEVDGDWAWVTKGAGWVHSAYLARVVKAAPHGQAAIRDMFGEPGGPLCSAGSVVLPRPLQLGFAESSVMRFACHMDMVDRFSRVFHRIHAEGYWSFIRTFDGCFNLRPKRSTGSDMSTHAWGIAVDLNAATNRQGTAGDMHAGIVECFKAEGFTWGGDWRGGSIDPMHFQYAAGY